MVTPEQVNAAVLAYEAALAERGGAETSGARIVAMLAALETYEASRPSIDGPEFDNLLNAVCVAAIDAHACGNDFGTGRERALAEEALVDFIDSRGAAS